MPPLPATQPPPPESPRADIDNPGSPRASAAPAARSPLIPAFSVVHDAARDDGDDAARGDDNSSPSEVVSDITTTHSPQSDKVSFEQLRLFSVETLTAGVYYNPDDVDQKPVVLAAMGYGVPDFPVIENDENVEKATSRSKSQMYNKSDVYPNTNRGKAHLQKEVMRRALMKTTVTSKLPRPKAWNVPKCIEHLKAHPPDSTEHEIIIEAWLSLIQSMKDYFLEQSCSGEARMWRHVRLTECMLHSSLRSKFRERNRQKTQYEIDAKNSNKLPPTYAHCVAQLFNSNVIIRSKALSCEYGPPFHEEVELRPPKKEHHLQGEPVRQNMVKDRGVFMSIRGGIYASGNGEGSISGDRVKDFVNRPKKNNKGKIVAHGDATGYRFFRFQEENELDDYLSVTPSGVAATMSNIPGIGNVGSAKHRRTPGSTASSAKKFRYEEDQKSAVGVAVNLFAKMSRRQSVSEVNDNIATLRLQVTAEETSLLQHQERVGSFGSAYFEWKQKVSSGEIVEGTEEYDMFELHRFNYTNCKDRIKIILERIESLKEELEVTGKELVDAKQVAEREERKEDGNAGKGVTNEKENVTSDVASVGSNDGSASLRDEDVPSFEHFV